MGQALRPSCPARRAQPRSHPVLTPACNPFRRRAVSPVAEQKLTGSDKPHLVRRAGGSGRRRNRGDHGRAEQQWQPNTRQPRQAPQAALHGPPCHDRRRLDHGGPRAHRWLRPRLRLLQAQRQHHGRRHQQPARHRPARRRRQRLHGHPRPRLGLPRRRQCRVRPRRGRRPLGHRDDRARLRGPQDGERGLRAPRHPRAAPRLHRQRRQDRLRLPARDVQHGVRVRRPGLCGEDRRKDVGDPHGPLHRGRLHRLQEAHRQAGRSEDHHRQAHQRLQEPSEPGAGHAHPRRGAVARSGPHPQEHRRRQRPRAGSSSSRPS